MFVVCCCCVCGAWRGGGIWMGVYSQCRVENKQVCMKECLLKHGCLNEEYSECETCRTANNQSAKLLDIYDGEWRHTYFIECICKTVPYQTMLHSRTRSVRYTPVLRYINNSYHMKNKHRYFV